MAFTAKDIARSIFYNLDRNLIGNEGCEYLSEAYWPGLNYINISSNKIKSGGVKHLLKANWP